MKWMCVSKVKKVLGLPILKFNICNWGFGRSGILMQIIMYVSSKVSLDELLDFKCLLT